MTTTHAEQQAVSQYEGIKTLVDLLALDYDRLEELREERESYEIEDPDANMADDGPQYANDREAWAGENPDEADELAELEKIIAEGKSAYGREFTCADDAREAIQEDPLCVEIRSDWATSQKDFEPAEFAILLCTGGPACRIRGTLDRGEPTRAWIEYQDWGTPWTEWHGADRDTLLAYCREFYYGE
jgi:hypothetical protein